MFITGVQHRQVQEAFLTAFDLESLRRLVRFNLDADLDAIVPPGDLTERTYALVAWADKHGAVGRLIEAACRENPSNPALQTLAQAAAAWWPPETAAQPDPADAAPYQGLASFDVADAPRFFGRESLVAEIMASLEQQAFLALVGASGSGKSSVLRAGVVPLLAQADPHLPRPPRPVSIITPTARPLESLAVALTQASPSLMAAVTLIDDMARDSRSLSLFLRREGGVAPAICVDQFEELFTLCKDKAERTAFVDNLLTAAQPGGPTVLIAMRADFYAQAGELDRLRPALARSQVYIGGMNRQELRAVIEKPAEQAGYALEPGLVDLILGELSANPGVLPHLSQALWETWNRRSGRTLTIAGYLAAGGVKGAIRQTAEELFLALGCEDAAGLVPSPPQPGAAPSPSSSSSSSPSAAAALTPRQQVLHDLLLSLTAVDEDAVDTGRRVSVVEAMAACGATPYFDAVKASLVARRLVVVDEKHIEVAHETLIREWERLAGWIDADRQWLRRRRLLAADVQAWEAQGQETHDDSLFYRGGRLWHTLDWAMPRLAQLTLAERWFLAASAVAFSAQEHAVGNQASARGLLTAAAELAPSWTDPFVSLFELSLADNDFPAALQAAQTLAAMGAPLLPDKYQVEAIVARGVFGIVLRATDSERQAVAAVTLAHAPSPAQPQVAADLGRALGALTSPQISQFCELGYWQGRYYLAREWVEGPTLRTLLAEQGKQPARTAYRMGAAVMAGLRDGHAQGLVHGGLTPDNIILTAQGAVMTGYGERTLLAALAPAQLGLAPRSLYLAPEQRDGAQPSPRSDIYSAGIIVNELFTGVVSPSGVEVLPSRVNRGADAALDQWVLRATAPEPQERFATADFAWRQLAAIGRTTSAGPWGWVDRPLRLVDRAVRWLGNSRVRLVLLLLVAAALLMEMPGTAEVLRAGSRHFLFLAVEVYLLGTLIYWRTRSAAIETRSVDLIQVGAGMGLLFAVALAIPFALNVTLRRQPVYLHQLNTSQFLSFLLPATILAFAYTALVLLTLFVAQRIAGRKQAAFNALYFALFGCWCAFFLVIAALPALRLIYAISVPP